LSRVPIVYPSIFILADSAPLKGQGEVPVLIFELASSEKLVQKLILQQCAVERRVHLPVQVFVLLFELLHLLTVALLDTPYLHLDAILLIH
jgi:hypothetical protein